jgi:hypothetical protein
MMTNITSLADFFWKCKRDNRYRKLAVMSYKHAVSNIATFRKAKSWIDGWSTTNRYNSRDCNKMVRYLNENIPLVATYLDALPEPIPTSTDDICYWDQSK